MTQVDYMFFLKLRVRRIQALPNSVQWIPNSWILFLITPNMSGKPKEGFQNLIKHFISLKLHLPINSSPLFSMKNKCFKVQLFLT